MTRDAKYLTLFVVMFLIVAFDQYRVPYRFLNYLKYDIFVINIGKHLWFFL